MEKSSFGSNTEVIEKKKFSIWYDLHFPAHEHKWGWCGSIQTYELLGRSCGVGARHPAWEVEEYVLLDFYKNGDRRDIEKYSADISSDSLDRQKAAVAKVIEWFIRTQTTEPNQAPQTTTMAVTPAASHPSRQPRSRLI